MQQFVHSTFVRVRTYELDAFGHVNNAVYLNYLEEARSELLKAYGLSFNDFAGLGVQLVIVEVQIKYLFPARYGNTVRVDLTVREVRSASLTLDFFMENEDRRAIASGQLRGAFVSATTFKPTRMPLPFLEAFRQAAVHPQQSEGS